MHTIHLKIHDKVYEKFIWLLSKFNKEEVEIISDDKNFISNQKYLKSELNDINSGNAVFISQSELEERLDNTISRHENNL